jgi:hypothetical protein
VQRAVDGRNREFAMLRDVADGGARP